MFSSFCLPRTMANIYRHHAMGPLHQLKIQLNKYRLCRCVSGNTMAGHVFEYSIIIALRLVQMVEKNKNEDI